MNVYDFDKTICKGDTECDFFFYELRHHPFNIFRIPHFIRVYLKHALKKSTREEYREGIYVCLKSIKDLDKELYNFWNKRKKKMLSWYMLNKKPDDVIVTATPRFLLESFFKEIGINNYICSEFDVKTRKCVGLMNYSEEKLRRFKLQYNINDIDAFYTDSLLDLPMLKVAKHPYIVKKYIPVEYIG